MASTFTFTHVSPISLLSSHAEIDANVRTARGSSSAREDAARHGPRGQARRAGARPLPGRIRAENPSRESGPARDRERGHGGRGGRSRAVLRGGAAECIVRIAGRRPGDRPTLPLRRRTRVTEPKMELLSSIIKTFNDQFGNIEWKDTDKVHGMIVGPHRALQAVQRQSELQEVANGHRLPADLHAAVGIAGFHRCLASSRAQDEPLGLRHSDYMHGKPSTISTRSIGRLIIRRSLLRCAWPRRKP